MTNKAKGMRNQSKKPEVSSSDKRFSHLDTEIQHWDTQTQRGNTFSSIQKKTKEELAQEMEARKEKKEITTQQQKNIEKFGKVLFLNLKDAVDNSKIGNTYLFKLTEDIVKKNKLYDGLYKIDVIKKDEKGIICRIVGGNYKKEIIINNEEIMKKKPEEDTLEEAYTITKTYYKDGQKNEKKRQGKKEDFIDEIQYGDSVVVDVQKEKIRKIDPDDLVEEIRGYIKSNDNYTIKNKKIQTAISFFNQSKEQISSEYIQDIFKLVRNKESKWNGGKSVDKIGDYKEHFAEVLKKFVNKEKLYLHRENDIDKSAVKFLLKKFGIDENKVFKEIEHDDAERFNEGIYFDVSGTVKGIKVVEKESITREGKKTIKRKKIVSEHTDASDEAMLSNRPSSTTQIIFKIFKELGAIDKDQLPQIQRFVNFVNTVDSMDYQISSIDYKHNYQTLFGLYRKIDIQDIFNYFENPENNGFERLSPGYMKKIKTITKDGKKSEKSLEETAEEHKKRIEKNIEAFNKIKKEGKELEYNKTKFIVDIEDNIENQIQDGPQTAGYHEYGFFNIKPERGNIYIYSPKKFPAMIEGFPTDGHFLIINNPTPETLEKLFEKFHTTDDKLKASIINHLKKIQEKNEKPITDNDIAAKCALLLSNITKKDLTTKTKTYSGIINNDIQNKLAYVSLDQEQKIKGRIKVEDRNELKKYKKGDIVRVKIDAIPEEEGKLLTLSLITTK